MDVWSCEANHFGYYIWSKDSYLSDPFENKKLLVFLVNGMILIIFFMAQDILFSVN